MSENVRHRYEPVDQRLGRHVNHDPRSRAYAVEPAADVAKLKSVRHVRRIAVLDQGQVGSCTGNAAVGCLGTGAFWTVGKTVLTGKAKADERFAVDVYSTATMVDPYDGTYPPTDTGSDGLSVAKALQMMKLIDGYRHAFSLEATLTALAKQPVIIGIPWHEYMDFPEQHGQLKPIGSVRGGHEVVLDTLDVEKRRVWLTNSWSQWWGIEGRAWLTWDNLGALLADNGDCTVFDLPKGARA